MNIDHNVYDFKKPDDKIKSLENLCDLKLRRETLMEKGSVELKESRQNKMLEKSDDEDYFKISNRARHSDFGILPISRRLDYDALNKDLTDIEERLRATRLGWNKTDGNGLENNVDILSDIFTASVGNKRSKSMIEMEVGLGGAMEIDYKDLRRNDMINKRQSCESPAMSEGLLKWDYGADIGLTQAESDDLEPITWPVTQEQAQQKKNSAAVNEDLPTGRIMKTSLSQGSFLSSPDPEDRRNMIMKASTGEYNKFNQTSTPNLQPFDGDFLNVSIDGSVDFGDTKYDETSARFIMEQAEEAERRLRQRLEAVKSLQMTGKPIKTNTSQESLNKSTKSKSTKENGNTQVEEVLNNDKVIQMEDKQPRDSEAVHQASGDERSKSPQSLSNTGRSTTLESTHTYSDYGKAPIFNSDVYGSRDDYPRNAISTMYSKKNKKDSKLMDHKSGRTICGIAPDLDTISSRETLQVSEERNEITNKPTDKFNVDKRGTDQSQSKQIIPSLHLNHVEVDVNDDGKNYVSDKDENQEYSLQAKWDKFKSMMKDEEFNPLFEKTSIRNASQYQPVVSSARQNSITTTFTTITNLSPRHDSSHYGPTDAYNPSPTRSRNKRVNSQNNGNTRYVSGETGNNRSNPPDRKSTKPRGESQNDRYRGSRNDKGVGRSYSPGKRQGLTNGNNGDDDDDDDERNGRHGDDVSQTHRRKYRHMAANGVTNNPRRRLGSDGGETTASELEHDDYMREEYNNVLPQEFDRRKFSELLTRVSQQAVADGEAFVDDDLTADGEGTGGGAGGGSSSVDTMMLMDRMSGLLGRKGISGHGDESKSKARRHYNDKRKPTSNDMRLPAVLDTLPNNSRVVESADARLALKHLLLKHKVKWLAECAREENRRRKIRKVEKLIDFYENGKNVIIPADVDTDTATLIGSDKGSIDDVNSLCESWSCHDEPVDVPAEQHQFIQPTKHADNKAMRQKIQSSSSAPYPSRQQCAPTDPQYNEHHPQQQIMSSSFRQQYFEHKNPKSGRNKSRKNHQYDKPVYYPPSEAWCIPLGGYKEGNVSNKFGCDDNEDDCHCQPASFKRRNLVQKYHHSPRQFLNNDCDEYESDAGKMRHSNRSGRYQDKSRYRDNKLSPKERIQLIHDLELARQRNAHECQKDIRHTRTGPTRVTNGGLAWVVNSDNAQDSNHQLQPRQQQQHQYQPSTPYEFDKIERKFSDENIKDRDTNKSDLQLVFEDRMTDFISRSRQRQKRIKMAADERRYESQMNQERAKIFLSDNNYQMNDGSVMKPRQRRPVTQPDPLSENLYKPRRRRVSKAEMVTNSARKYNNLPEVQERYMNERKKAKIQNNRMKMMMYGEKILQGVLRGRGPWVTEKT